MAPGKERFRPERPGTAQRAQWGAVYRVTQEVQGIHVQARRGAPLSALSPGVPVLALEHA